MQTVLVRCRSEHRASRSLAWLVAAAIAAWPTGATAQVAGAPAHFAITNARLVTVSGEIIDGGTIVMEDGVIAAVGRNVDVPASAWVLDGSGLTVYPGLIDGLSSVGLPAAERRRPAAGFGGGGGPQGGDPSIPYAWGPEDRPATTPWVNAADLVRVDEDAFERWRNAGFTTAVTSPSEGLFPGQAAVINLAGARPNDLVVKTPVALRVTFERGATARGYPASLLGAIAYVRQTFYDAQHYAQAWAIYERKPLGQERPEYDRSLEPLRETFEGSRPVIFPGVWAREIQRVIQMGRDLGVAALVVGGHQGYAVADELASAQVPVLVSLDWPAQPRDGDPDADIGLDVLRFRDFAPTTPARFAEAGVEFAFYSDGISDPATVIANARFAVDMGLDRADAIAAFTLGSARIFGVEDRLGSLDVGKIANVVVADGDLFTEGTTVQMVFVDGRKYDVDASSETVARGSGPNGQGRRGTDAAATRPTSLPMQAVVDRGIIAEADVTLIRNATILTVSGAGTIQNGSVLIRDGKIAAIGQDIDAPRGAKIIDASGQYVMPGIIDAHSHIAADAINEGSINSSAMVGIEDVINPDQVGIYRALAGGVTTANVLHGSANPIGGKNAVIKLRWGNDAEGLMLAGAPPGIKFALGENVKRDRNPERYPNSRMGVQDVIRQSFIEAQEYMAEWDQYERLYRNNPDVIPPRRDLEMETLAEVLRGERLVHAHSYRADEILQLLRTAEEFGVRIATLQHVLEGYRVADEIAEHGAGASTFSDWWGYKVEAYEAIPYNAAIMTERGVVVSINSDSGEEIRHLNQEAAKSMKWGGLTEEQALRLVTLNPALQLGISDRVGSLEVGKDADIAIFNAHPLSVYAVPQMTLIDGQVYFDRNVDIERRDDLQAEKQQRLDRQKGQSGRQRVVTPDMAGVR